MFRAILPKKNYLAEYGPKYILLLLEMPGIEPGAFHMQSERATTALHPLPLINDILFPEQIRARFSMNLFFILLPVLWGGN